MKYIIFLLSFLLFFNNTFAQYQFNAIGRVHYIDKNQAKEFNGHQWFFVVQKDGKTYFYPLKSKANTKSLKQGDFIKLEGELVQESFKLKEREISLTVLNAKSLEKLKLSNLSAGPKDELNQIEPRFTLMKSKSKGKGGAVSDKVAEGVIFTAGAILLGSILKNAGDK